MQEVQQKIERARAYLAATVGLTPDTPAAELLAAAAQCRAHLAAVVGVIGDQELAARRVPSAPPLETERQARELPAVRAVYEAFDADPGAGKMTAPSLRMLLDAAAAAGVQAGAFDVRILEWLAGWEPATCAVIAGLITRAAAAGQKMLPPGYESVLGQAVRDAIKWCGLQGGEDLAEQAAFYRSVARRFGIAVDR